MDDCEKVSNTISVLLDETDYIKEQYFLEVSSPGIERVLRKNKHFKESIGKKIEVKLYKPIKAQKQIIGILNNFNDDTLELKLDDDIYLINRKDIALIKTIYDWK